MSAFALPIPPRLLTDTASQAYGTLRYRTVVSCQASVFRQVFTQAMQHSSDLAQFVLPGEGLLAGDVAEIGGVVAPQSRFVGRPDRHRQIAAEFGV